MLCSGCGKDIPSYGEVCPYCQRAKADNPSALGIITVAIIGGAALGYFLSGASGLMWGLLVGALIGVGMTVYVGSEAKTESKPPAVRVVNENSSTDAQAPLNSGSAKKRLAELDDLKSSGLISEDEHAEKRKRILDEL